MSIYKDKNVQTLNEIRREEAMNAARRTYQRFEQINNQPVTPANRITSEMLQRIENIR